MCHAARRAERSVIVKGTPGHQDVRTMKEARHRRSNGVSTPPPPQPVAEQAVLARGAARRPGGRPRSVRHRREAVATAQGVATKCVDNSPRACLPFAPSEGRGERITSAARERGRGDCGRTSHPSLHAPQGRPTRPSRSVLGRQRRSLWRPSGGCDPYVHVCLPDAWTQSSSFHSCGELARSIYRSNRTNNRHYTSTRRVRVDVSERATSLPERVQGHHNRGRRRSWPSCAFAAASTVLRQRRRLSPPSRCRHRTNAFLSPR